MSITTVLRFTLTTWPRLVVCGRSVSIAEKLETCASFGEAQSGVIGSEPGIGQHFIFQAPVTVMTFSRKRNVSCQRNCGGKSLKRQRSCQTAKLSECGLKRDT